MPWRGKPAIAHPKKSTQNKNPETHPNFLKPQDFIIFASRKKYEK